MSPRSTAGVAFCRLLGTVLVWAFCTSASAQVPGEMRKIADIFQPLSRQSEMILEPTVLVLLTSLGIFLVVMAMLVYVVWRFRSRGPEDDAHEPPQIYGSNNIELAWTVIPCLIVFVLVLVTARTIVEIENHPIPEDAVKIRLVGHQWWWEIHYPDLGIITANELHVPVSSKDGKRRPTEIFLESADVIHSFWVPQLAGKTDVIPNRRNRTWVEPFETGTFFGNCAEYCGTQHANMLLRVIVHEPEDFDRWVANQQAPPPTPESALALKGKADFDAISCINCHTVGGSVAKGVFGPDLTKLMTRQTIGAGVAPLTTENLREWLRDPQTLKPGCHMPDMKLNNSQLDSIVAYLETLK